VKDATGSLMRGIGQRFVYILRSESDPTRHYVGVTADVGQRLDWHNGGGSGYTTNHRPWRVIVSVEFQDEPSAVRFETYLKSGSGRAFAKRHFGQPPPKVGKFMRPRG
jgi:putative endonuclease